ncbi:MAG: dnaK 1 [Verrucomicrobiales bacterium]|nr:dnaK 1 [Verrucomicrobiales bacterium]
MSHPVVAGIDLGTTNSCIAVVLDGQLTVIPVDGRPTMPSAVGLDPSGRLIIGQPAKNQEVSAPENTILSIKRHMGTDYKVTLGDKTFSPEEISALILGELKRAAEAHLGQPVTQTVITVPAFFNEAQRKATQAAGQLAGLEVLRIINEPTAAALAYGAGDSSKPEGETMLVYDLGGGTFDVSVVRVEQGVVEVKASFGDVNLGGDDFDSALAARAADLFAAQPDAPPLNESARRRLKGVMEKAKITLSDDPFAKVAEDYLTPAHHLQAEFSRSEYEDLIEPSLDVTISCVRQAMSAAGVTAGQIDKIMLVGGATRTPAVHTLLEMELHKTPHHEIDPDLIVAMGAAIQGAALAGQPAPAILIDITAHTYSVSAVRPDDTSLVICAPIIPRGTPLPVRRAESYITAHDNQTAVRVDVFQGEYLMPEDNTHLGGMMVEGLSKQPAGSVIVIEFRLDLNGILTATAIEKITGLTKAIALDTRGQHRLNLDAARANLDALFAEAEENALDLDDEDEGDNDDGDDDDDEVKPEEVLEMETEETPAPKPVGGKPRRTAAGSPATTDANEPAALLATAKSLRRRAEAALATGLSPRDQGDIQTMLETVSSAIQNRDWSNLESITDRLSDLLFYLED